MYAPHRSARRLVPESSINPDGYREVWDSYKQRYVGEHRHMFERAFGPIPTRFEVHHIDLDRLNNSPNNLVALPKGEHNRLHRLHEQLETVEYEIGRTSVLNLIQRFKLNREAEGIADEMERIMEEGRRYQERSERR